MNIPTNLTKETYTSEISNGLSLVLFSQESSVIGHKIEFILSNKLKETVKFYRVNIDTEKDLAAKLNIRISPILFQYDKGILINTYTMKDIREIETSVCNIQ